mgnify:CR=1 FL=1
MLRTVTPIKGGSKIHVEYETYDELIQACSKPHPGGRVARESESPDSSGWAGTRDYPSAMTLMVQGWPQGRDRMLKALEISNRISKPAVISTTDYDVGGAYPNVALAVAGDPACMVDLGDLSNLIRPIVKIIIPRVVSASVSTQAIENFGGALLASIDRLEAEGRQVDLIGRFLVVDAPYRMMIDVPLKSPGEPLDIDRLAYSLVHPAFIRRIMFRAYELDPTVGPHTRYYGIPADPLPDEIEGAIWIPGPSHYDLNV